MASAKKRPSAWVPSRPDKRGSAPASLAEVLVGAQSFVAKQIGAAMSHEEWRVIVGSRIAGRTRVGKNFKGTLTIKVASSAWSNELSFLKSDLLSKLRRAGHDFTDLRFRVDKIAKSSAPARKSAWRPHLSGTQSSPKELPLELQKQLQKVDDPNLRAAIFEAASWSLRDRKA